jgi:hypothetical protein
VCVWKNVFVYNIRICMSVWEMEEKKFLGPSYFFFVLFSLTVGIEMQRPAALSNYPFITSRSCSRSHHSVHSGQIRSSIYTSTSFHSF